MFARLRSLGKQPTKARLLEALREAYAAISPGYHLNKRHWISLRLDGSVPDELVEELLRESYGLVRASLPRSVRDAVGTR